MPGPLDIEIVIENGIMPAKNLPKIEFDVFAI